MRLSSLRNSVPHTITHTDMCIKDILEEREKTKQKTSEETTTDNPPQFNDEHQRSSANSKEDKFKEILFLIHYYQMGQKIKILGNICKK